MDEYTYENYPYSELTFFGEEDQIYSPELDSAIEYMLDSWDQPPREGERLEVFAHMPMEVSEINFPFTCVLEKVWNYLVENYGGHEYPESYYCDKKYNNATKRYVKKIIKYFIEDGNCTYKAAYKINVDAYKWALDNIPDWLQEDANASN